MQIGIFFALNVSSQRPDRRGSLRTTAFKGIKNMHIESMLPGSPALPAPAASAPEDPAQFSRLLAERLEDGATATARRSEWVPLGTISARRPTVSHLLIRHPRYGSDCWRIIHSETNQGKRFERLQSGTPIWLNPGTGEIAWGPGEGPAACDRTAAVPETLRAPASPPTAAALPLPETPFSSELVQAVRPYIGRPYAEMNCYDLVVQGLEKIGVRYHGSGGLKSRLLEMALAGGRPANAFLNGEGLIRASGETVYTTSLKAIETPAETAGKVYAAMAPHLAAGQILSFSTPTRGHTGVIAKHDSQWTFINSGRVDHPVAATGTAKGVSEETLQAEIANWLRLAHRRGEPLHITLGRFQDRKLAQFRDSMPAAVQTV